MSHRTRANLGWSLVQGGAAAAGALVGHLSIGVVAGAVTVLTLRTAFNGPGHVRP